MGDKKSSRLAVTSTVKTSTESVPPEGFSYVSVAAKYRAPGVSISKSLVSFLPSGQPSSVGGPQLAKSLYSVSSALNQRTRIGLLGCIIVVIGCVLGSGIFAAPQEILKITQNASMTLLIWFSYGMIALVAALCYVELGCTIPVSGGDYAYLNECFGNFPAFLFQWSSNFVVIPASSAVMASVVAKNILIGCSPDIDLGLPCAKWATCFLAIFFLCLFSYINCTKAELTEKVQGSLMIVNIIAISLIICCGLVHIAQHGISKDVDFELKLPVPNHSGITSSGAIVKFQVLTIVQALYQASFSYFGYTYLNYITEDLENPMRNLPLGVCISIPIIISLNVFVNFCYIATLPQKRIMNTHTIASEMFGIVLPPGDYVKYVQWIAPILVAVAVTGGLSANFLTCSRISFTGARNGHFPEIFGMIHVENNSPMISMIWIAIIGSLFLLVGEIPILIAIATYLETAFNCVCIYGLIYLRITKPNLNRPIKLPLVLPISYALVATFLFFVPILSLDESNYKNILPGLAGAIFVIFTGVPVYFIFIHKKRHWPCLQKLQASIMRFLQKILMVIPEDQIILREVPKEETIPNASVDQDEKITVL